MTLLNFAFVVATGGVVGLINGMAGGASIISYPVMLAVGLNPLQAVVTNAVGVTSANFLALRAHHTPVRTLARANLGLITASIFGTLIGAIALLTQPIAVLEKAIPWLLLTATSTLLIPVRPEKPHMSARTEGWAIFGTGLYCGYFGPGQGVMVSATLARDPRRDPGTLNATKNTVVGFTALVSDIAYAVSGHVHWGYAAALALGAGIGGMYGGRWARVMSPLFYRALLMTVGIGSSLWLFSTYY